MRKPLLFVGFWLVFAIGWVAGVHNVCHVLSTTNPRERIPTKWWALLSGTGVTGKTMLWFERTDGPPGPEEREISNDEIFPLLMSHNLHYDANQELFQWAPWQRALKPDPKSPRTEDALKNTAKLTSAALEKANVNVYEAIGKLAVLQMWANDQPSTTYSKPRGQTRVTNIQKYKSAHSKWLMSVGLKSDPTAANAVQHFYLQHSFPQTPIKVEPKYFQGKDQLIERLRDEDEFWAKESRLVKSQHAFCKNIPDDKLDTFLDYLYQTFPHMSILPVPRALLEWVDEQDKDREQDCKNLPVEPTNCKKPAGPSAELKAMSPRLNAIFRFYNMQPDEGCTNDWKDLTFEARAKKMLGTTSHSCTNYLDFDGVQFIFHSPVLAPQLRGTGEGKEKKANTATDNRPVVTGPARAPEYYDFAAALERGPFPWLTVANKMNTDLNIYCWKNQNLPSMSPSKLTFLAESRSVALAVRREGRELHEMHEKIGFSPKMNVVCFGDSNHRKSEITHAGTMACMTGEATSDMLAYLRKGFKEQDVPQNRKEIDENVAENQTEIQPNNPRSEPRSIKSRKKRKSANSKRKKPDSRDPVQRQKKRTKHDSDTMDTSPL